MFHPNQQPLTQLTLSCSSSGCFRPGKHTAQLLQLQWRNKLNFVANLMIYSQQLHAQGTTSVLLLLVMCLIAVDLIHSHA